MKSFVKNWLKKFPEKLREIGGVAKSQFEDEVYAEFNIIRKPPLDLDDRKVWIIQ
jgi:hypothetical protein